MKFLKMVILMLALSMLAWAQNPTPDETAPAQSKTESSCQDRADAKDGKSCCGHDMAAKGGRAMTCCAEKSACMKDGKCIEAAQKMAAACAKDGCCAKDGDKAMECCQRAECPMGGMNHAKEAPAAK